MEPVLPGYSGMLPSNAHEKLGVNVADGGNGTATHGPPSCNPPTAGSMR